jgi:hypothetical protein
MQIAIRASRIPAVFCCSLIAVSALRAGPTAPGENLPQQSGKAACWHYGEAVPVAAEAKAERILKPEYLRVCSCREVAYGRSLLLIIPSSKLSKEQCDVFSKPDFASAAERKSYGFG